MTRPGRYSVPAGRIRVEETIGRSRFVTTVGHAPTIDDARAFVAEVSGEFDTATHNCWAYVVGPPGDTSRVGMSDDGEPHGTAGRPMLHVILHSGIGDAVAVVTRFYGGIKLGRGGLARAYSGGVRLAIDQLPTRELVATSVFDLALDYALLEVVKRSFAEFEVDVLAEDFGERVVLRVELPNEQIGVFTAAVAGMTSGTANMTKIPSDAPTD